MPRKYLTALCSFAIASQWSVKSRGVETPTRIVALGDSITLRARVAEQELECVAV